MSSMLIMKYNKTFCERFSSEIVSLEWYKDIRSSTTCCIDVSGCDEKCSHIDNAFITKVPASPADEGHWGHLAWLYCNFMEKVKYNNILDKK